MLFSTTNTRVYDAVDGLSMGNLYVRMSRRLEVAQLPKVDFVSLALSLTPHTREKGRETKHRNTTCVATKAPCWPQCPLRNSNR